MIQKGLMNTWLVITSIFYSIDLDASIMDPASLPISSCHITSTRVCTDLEPLSDASQPLPSQQSSQQQSTSQQSAFLFSSKKKL